MIRQLISKYRAFLQAMPDSQLVILSILCALPAFLIHLPLTAFIGDECIRTLVAFEMKASGNFIMPTLNGVEYFNKPPLFNWMVYLISQCFGYFGELPTRLLSLIFLFLFALSTNYFVKPYVENRMAILLPLTLLTSGRILFWDSMYGLIDICFSWIVFLNFISLYHFGKKNQWSYFFLISYGLCSIAFLLKGLPALVFQFISVLYALYFHGVLRTKLFNRQHILFAFLGLIPVFMYYLSYGYYVSLPKAFAVLLEQSMSRTLSNHTFADTLVHIGTFPFEQMYHFLPWSLFLLLLLWKKGFTYIKESGFVHYCFWIMVLNLPVYWTSVEVYPRYLLMFIPLFNLVGLHLFYTLIQEKPGLLDTVQKAFILLTVLLIVPVLGLPLIPQVKALPGITWIWLGGSFLLFFLWLNLLVDKTKVLFWFCFFMLGLRIVFDLTILPIRNGADKNNICRTDSRRIHDTYRGQRFFIYDSTEIHQVARFYHSRDFGGIIHKIKPQHTEPGIYFVDPEKYPDFPGTKLDSAFLENGQFIPLMKIEQ